MQQKSPSDTNSESNEVAFLVVREAGTWRDVFRLVPGKVSTVGRAPTNRIVLRDEICSRNHCEIFQSGKRWTLRDLGSRNGTLVDGVPVSGDRSLNEGELIQIGTCDLAFTYDASKPFDRFDRKIDPESDTETALDIIVETPPSDPGTSIIQRRKRSRFQAPGSQDTVARDRTSQELANLYRLALDMGSVPDAKALSEVVLDGLLSGTSADIGAILLLPDEATSKAKYADLQVVAYKSNNDAPYQKVSDYLSNLVLAELDAVLARDVTGDRQLSERDSLGEIRAKSVICSPIRMDNRTFGVIHLYSTNPDNPLDPDDLEFTLAVADQLAVALGNLKQKETLAVGLARAQDEAQTLREQLGIESELVGDSAEMDQLRETIARIAPTDATALILGESGVGKELVARAIHFSSPRHDNPFVCMNCAALSESLLESELFGHEKGSFTGATSRKFGKFEQAHKGTLFLDEVGEMSLPVQAKFLRVLEGHPFERVGGGTRIDVDVRVVAATNRNLDKAVEEGRFRRDLYFRLHVVEIEVPSLRDHASDIPQLAGHFLKRYTTKTSRAVERFTDDALELMVKYHWPGNVRELQNTVERAVILCSGREVTAADIHLTGLQSPEPTSFSAPKKASGYREVSLDVMEQEHILATLDRTNWNKSQAAQILGIERSTLDRKLKRYQVSRPKS